MNSQRPTLPSALLERRKFEKVMGRGLRLSQCRLDGDRSCDFRANRRSSLYQNRVVQFTHDNYDPNDELDPLRRC